MFDNLYIFDILIHITFLYIILYSFFYLVGIKKEGEALSSHIKDITEWSVQNNKNLQETLNFIIDLNLIEVEGNKIFIKEYSNNLKDLVIKKIIEKPKYSIVLKTYLNNFVNDGNIIKTIKYGPISIFGVIIKFLMLKIII